MGLLQWLFHFGEVIITTCTHRVSKVDVPRISLCQWCKRSVTAAGGVTPCIFMNNDEVLYHQVLSFSPECWKKVVLQVHTVVGSIYHMPWKYCVVQYYPIGVIHRNEHHLHSTLCRAHFLWMRRTGMLPFI